MEKNNKPIPRQTTINRQSTPQADSASQTPLIAVIALVIGLLAIAGLGFSYWITKNNLTQVEQITFSMQRHMQTTQQLQGDITTLQDQVRTQQNLITNLQDMSKGNVATWRMAEVKYLVQLAYYHLTFTRDIPAALALLQSAEQRVAQINDPNLLSIRQLIANNIAALQAVPKIDLAGLLTRITALQMQATKLPTIGLPRATETAVEEDTDVKSASPLRKAIHDSWVTLQKIVVIRHQDKPIQPLLSPEQQAYLQQNLQLILQQAQWAALRGQGDVYQNSLIQARKWIENYFAKSLPATQAFVQAITDLQKINVQPSLPDLGPMTRKIQLLSYIAPKQQRNA